MRSDTLRKRSLHRRRLASARWSQRAEMSKQSFVGLIAGWSTALLGVLLVSVVARGWG